MLVTSGQSTGLVFWVTWCHVQDQQARARDGPPAEASHSVDNLGKLPSTHSLVRLARGGQRVKCTLVVAAWSTAVGCWKAQLAGRRGQDPCRMQNHTSCILGSYRASWTLRPSR